MNKINKSLMAAMLLAALPLSNALACTIDAWTGSPSATAPTANGPQSAESNARYSGLCALSADAGQFVVDNFPGAEGVYRARFYVLTSAVTSAATIFKATASDNGQGATVVSIDLGAGGTSLSFNQNGTSAGTITGLTPGRWYSVEFLYKAYVDAANPGSFEASVAGNVSFTGSIPATPLSAGNTGTIGSAVLGFASGTGPALRFDAFESTRSADTPIGRLCRGDASGDSSLSIADRVAINNEILGNSVVTGQPDCTEDGAVSIADRVCLSNRVLAADTCP